MIKNKHNDTTFHPTTVSHFPSMNPQAICTVWKLMKSQTSLTHHYNTQSHTIIWELECQGDKVLKINYSPFLRPLFLVVSTTRVAYFICRPIQQQKVWSFLGENEGEWTKKAETEVRTWKKNPWLWAKYARLYSDLALWGKPFTALGSQQRAS